MSISVVIPNYNGAHLLKANIESVIDAVEFYSKKERVKVEVIINDDFSVDNSLDVLRDLQNTYRNKVSIEVMQNDKNYGFSTTVNRGVAKAFGDIVILLNTDVRPDKEFLTPLLSHFSDPEVFAVACMDKSLENGKTVLRGRGIGRWERGFLVHAAGKLDKSDTLWASGGSSAFRKNMWDKLGGMNEAYNPFYWEDIDLSYRARKVGYKIIFEQKSTVVHEHEKGAIKSKYSHWEVKKIAYRNQFLFAWSNLTDSNLILQHVMWLPYHVLKAMANKEWIFLFGFYNAFLSFSDVRRQRVKMKKLFTQSDASLEIYEDSSQ